MKDRPNEQLLAAGGLVMTINCRQELLIEEMIFGSRSKSNRYGKEKADVYQRREEGFRYGVELRKKFVDTKSSGRFSKSKLLTKPFHSRRQI